MADQLILEKQKQAAEILKEKNIMESFKLFMNYLLLVNNSKRYKINCLHMISLLKLRLKNQNKGTNKFLNF